MLKNHDNARAGRWPVAAGVLIPLALFCLAWLASAKPIQDYDFWWHLATGRYIAETGSLPEQDPFSYITPAIDGAGDETRTLMTLRAYWLAQLFIYYIYKGFSFQGIVAYKGLVYAFVLLLMYLLMRRGGMRPWTSALLLMPFLFPEVMEYLNRWTGERPGNLSFVMALFLVYLLERIREPVLRGERPHYALLVALLPVMALWSNLHPGYILGVIIICMYLAEIVLLPVVMRRRPDGTRMLVLYAGLPAIAVSALNPNGLDAFRVALDIARATVPVRIFEEMSPVEVWRIGIEGTAYAFYYLMGIICLGLPVIRRLGVSRALVTAFVVIISFGAQRHVEELVFICYPLIAGAWAGLVRERAVRLVPPAKAVVAVTVLLALVAGYKGAHRYTETGYSISGAFPGESAEFIMDHRPQGNLFNYYDWGGFLIWKLYPKYKVFVDGRLLSYTAAGSYRAVTGSPDAGSWRMMSSVYGFNTAILPPYSTAGLPVGLFTGILESHDWAPVFKDEVSVVFVRRNRANAPIINANEIHREEILKWVDEW